MTGTRAAREDDMGCRLATLPAAALTIVALAGAAAQESKQAPKDASAASPKRESMA